MKDDKDWRACLAKDKTTTVGNVLKEHGRITSTGIRALCGAKRPSAIIAKLKKRGLRIHSEAINTRYGRQMAIYTLAKRKPPRIRIDPCREISSFWKWRR